MAKSRFEYVRKFEQLDRCLQNTWIVVRIDGKGFHRFSERHDFQKPNDDRALGLMNSCAASVLTAFQDVIIGYGQSDEYSFVFKRKTETYNRRASKLASTVVSLFTSNYVYNWEKHFPTTELIYPPSFDSRVVLYPTTRNLRDYLSWRQVDCHINNMYNTCFWKLVLEGGLSNQEAEARLKVTDSRLKNELLFSEYNTNYNDEAEIHKKGTVVYKEKEIGEKFIPSESPSFAGGEPKAKIVKESRTVIKTENVDIIKDAFWKMHPTLLGDDINGDGD